MSKTRFAGFGVRSVVLATLAWGTVFGCSSDGDDGAPPGSGVGGSGNAAGSGNATSSGGAKSSQGGSEDGG
ncbi:MAG TPA: hypothetical protein VKY73_18545, partial [Polyangiaceae bacterium]|nr:hypothetical protein [Polyangiaceae bacterium]